MAIVPAVARQLKRVLSPTAYNAVKRLAGRPVYEHVEEGQRLGVLEAMKMAVALKAPFAGTVAQVGGAAGDLVQLKQVLFLVEHREVMADD